MIVGRGADRDTDRRDRHLFCRVSTSTARGQQFLFLQNSPAEQTGFSHRTATLHISKSLDWRMRRRKAKKKIVSANKTFFRSIKLQCGHFFLYFYIIRSSICTEKSFKDLKTTYECCSMNILLLKNTKSIKSFNYLNMLLKVHYIWKTLNSNYKYHKDFTGCILVFWDSCF